MTVEQMLLKKVKELRGMLDEANAAIDSLDKRLIIEININNDYRDFFTNHPDYCNWMRDHNAQFQAFKNSPYWIAPSVLDRRLSTIGKKRKKR